MKSTILATAFFCTMLACGSGMIGLLQEDQHGRLVMDHVYVLDSGSVSYFIEVIGYYEPLDCDTQILENVSIDELNVWKSERKWGDLDAETELLENGYFGIIQISLHDEYVKLVCGQ